MPYAINKMYYTLQGEGVHTGRPAVFCRFAGCNLWSGREADREEAICQFCDTDFVGTDGPGGGRYETPDALVDALDKRWPNTAPNEAERFIVCTGGEPLLQRDEAMLAAMYERNFEVAVETNGTCQPPDGLDWICVSPKPTPT